MSEKLYYTFIGIVAIVLVIPMYVFIWTNPISLSWLVVILIVAFGIGLILSHISDYFKLIIGTNYKKEKSPPLNLTKSEPRGYRRTFDIKTNYSSFSNRSNDVDTSKPTMFIMGKNSEKISKE
ncbi:hypothetical protein BSK66_27600 [Paenibacillus odorifer]|uniref:hypothetical protein n=1 Tax=Paenibacillus TaxID=44249 RepID=UPI0003E2B9C7|nr:MULTISPECIES: hypothetical protein [Paenibacillus]ETT61311.1 hypothetical protein C171_12653 [Paenibacillus sp. FSL H8-237]OMD13724.1 hypothetical protein BJP47_24150 [Paenibacillus odorifer]OME48954.1 hypothetical protein BSK66_27600 [Paenibacillus odorifer]